MNLSELVNDALPHTLRFFDKVQIRNEVNLSIETIGCNSSLKTVVGALLEYAFMNGYGNSIRVTAKKYNNIVLLQVRFKGRSSQLQQESSLDKLKPVTNSLGGCLYITHSNSNETTLSITFQNRRNTLVASKPVSHTLKPVITVYQPMHSTAI